MSFEAFNRTYRRRESIRWWLHFVFAFLAALAVIAGLWFVVLTATAP